MGLLSRKTTNAAPVSSTSGAVLASQAGGLPARRERTNSVEGGTLAEPSDAMIAALLGEVTSSTGVKVTPLKAVGVSTVFACVRILCRTIAAMPVDVFVREDETSFRRADDKPRLRRLLRSKPNEEMTAYNFKTAVQYHLGLRNSSFAQIQRNRLDEPVGLIPLLHDDVEMYRDRPSTLNVTGALRYRVKGQVLDSSEILRITDFTRDGLTGIDVSRTANEVIGLAIALDRSANKLFANGARLSGVLHTDSKLDPERRNALKEQMREQYSGAANSGKTLVLEQGLKWMQTQASNRDAEFTASKRAQAFEVCRLFGIQPHQVGILDDATLNNVESMGLEFLKYGVMPMITMWEQALGCALFTDEEIEAGYVVRFDFSDLLRADLKSLTEYFSKARQGGWLNSDEIRSVMNMNPIPGGAGQTYLTPLNMTELGTPQE